MLIEEEPPAGYAYSQNVEFTVPQEPEPITITMKDKKTEVSVEKLGEAIIKASPSEAARRLPGSTLQILNKDKTPAKALRNDNDFKAGDDLIFTTGDQLKEIKGQLVAGGNYWLHEVKPADGYAYAEDIAFTTSLNGHKDIVIMIDDPTHVILSKKAMTGEEELPGNHMSVMDKDGKTIEEWISGEHPHELIAKLKAGESYWLRELHPIDGYSFADDVPFTVSRTGVVDIIEMKNEVTIIRLNKVDPSGQLLKGAILQVLDHQKSIVIPDFETTGEAIDIKGKLVAGNTYYLHEVKAPLGYLLSADIAFTVPKEKNVLEVTMIDPKEQSHESKDKMQLYKTNASTGQGIEGVEFSVYRPDGSLYLIVSTGKEGYATFNTPADGTYTYRETKAAPGYLATDHTYSFTVQNGEVSGNSTVSVVNYTSPDVLIRKISVETSKGLFGAELEVRDQAGIPVLTGVSDENGQLLFHPQHTGKYTVHEKKAPKGYVKTDAYVTFYVADDGTVTGETTMYNNLEHGKKKGMITASYQSSLSGLGIINHNGKGFWGWLSKLPKTGDIGIGGRLFLIAGLAGIATSIVIIRRRREKKNEK